ncbi:MAG TPA: guanylate kinase [Candidatus Pelagibacter sp.]|nr:guanylate kinase [Candidatus Pelagibacter sp.]
MSLNNDGIMVILSSPSGVGKTTLVKLLSKSRDFYTSISHTTRKPRNNEEEGKDYYFVNNDQFQNLIKKKEFLEYANVFSHLYGTTKTPVIKNLENSKNVVFDIDWQGTEQIKKKNLEYKLLTLFVLPPSKKALFNRLSNRDMKDKLIVDERMKEFNKDVLHWKSYDYVVINDDLQRCFKEICELIDSFIDESKNNYDRKLIEKHISKLTL